MMWKMLNSKNCYSPEKNNPNPKKIRCQIRKFVFPQLFKLLWLFRNSIHRMKNISKNWFQKERKYFRNVGNVMEIVLHVYLWCGNHLKYCLKQIGTMGWIGSSLMRADLGRKIITLFTMIHRHHLSNFRHPKYPQHGYNHLTPLL